MNKVVKKITSSIILAVLSLSPVYAQKERTIANKVGNTDTEYEEVDGFIVPKNKNRVLIYNDGSKVELEIQEENEKEYIYKDIVVDDKNKNFKKAVIWNNYEKLVEACSVYCDVNEGFYEGNNALHLSAKFGNEKMFHYLVNAGAKWKKNDYGETPLHWAVYSGNKDILAVINKIQSKKEYLVANKDGLYPIHYLFKNYLNNDEQLLKQVVSKTGSCSVKDVNDKTDFTVAHYAVLSEYKYHYKALQENGCDLFYVADNVSRPIDLLYKRNSDYSLKEELNEFELVATTEKKG